MLAPRRSRCPGKFTVLLALFALLLLYTFCPQALVTSIAGWSESHPSAMLLRNQAAELSDSIVGQFKKTVTPSSSYMESYKPADMAPADDEDDGPPIRRVLAEGEDDGFVLERVPLVEFDENFPQDSTAETLMIKPVADKDLSHSYHICTFTNVCVAPDGIKFRFQNHAAWKSMEELAKKCESKAYYWANKICHCFHYAFTPQVMPYEFYTEVTQPLLKVRYLDQKRGDGKNSLDRRYPDPFKHVQDADHQHFWSIHKWVSHHHIAHWAQKLMIFQSIFQHHHLFQSRIPPLTGMVFHDTSNTHPPLEDHLLSVFNLSVESALNHKHEDGYAHPLLWKGNNARDQMSKLLDPDRGRLIWHEDIVDHRYTTTLSPDTCKDPKHCAVPNPAWVKAIAHLPADQVKKHADGTVEVTVPVHSPDGHELKPKIPDPNLHTCFARVSMSPTYGLLSLDPRDSDTFRAVTAKRMNLPPSRGRCPPRRAILLTRSDRKILNQHELLEFMQKTYRLKVELHEITGRNTSAEQVHLFATTGLILSSHSSQMINVLFSHPSQSLIEITPEFYNIDFSAYAHAIGLNFNYAVGGTIPVSHHVDPGQSKDYTYQKDPLMLECVAALQTECPTGDSWCFINKSHGLCDKVKHWPNKQMNFYANMTAVRIAVEQSVAHIEDRCFGKW